MPPNFEAPSDGSSRSSTSDPQEPADENPAPGGAPQPTPPTDEPNRYPTSEPRVPEDENPAPGGDPQPVPPTDEPARGPQSRPGSEENDVRAAPGGDPKPVRPDSSQEDLQAAADAAAAREREISGIASAEEQRARTVGAGERGGRPAGESEEDRILSGADSLTPSVSGRVAGATKTALGATVPIGAAVRSRLSRDKESTLEPGATAGDVGLRDIATDPIGSLGAIQRGGEVLPAGWHADRNTLRSLVEVDDLLNEDAGSGDFDALSVGGSRMRTDIEVKGVEADVPVAATGPGPFGAGAAGAKGAGRAVSALSRTRPWELSSGAARTGPVGGAQVAESVAQYGRFAPEGVGKVTATGAVGAVVESELDAPTNRNEFDVTEVEAPTERSEFDVNEVEAPTERSEFTVDEVPVPENTEAEQFNEVPVPDDVGGAPGSDSVVINDDGDVSVLLNTQQLYGDLVEEEEEEDDLLGVPEEFLPDEEVIIGTPEREGIQEEVVNEVEEPEIDWTREREILDGSTQRDVTTTTEQPLEDTYRDGLSEAVSEPSVGTGSTVGGLLDEQAGTGIEDELGDLPQVEVPTTPEFTQPTTPGFVEPTIPDFAEPTVPEFDEPTIPEYPHPTVPEPPTSGMPSGGPPIIPTPEFDIGGGSSSDRRGRGFVDEVTEFGVKDFDEVDDLVGAGDIEADLEGL